MADYPMNWWEYDKLYGNKPFATSNNHRIIAKRESLPIVFIPGIMGSRLKRGSTRIWDPSSTRFMATTYGMASPADRQRLLIGDPSQAPLEPDIDTSDSFKQTVNSGAFNQQVGGFWGSMGFGSMPPSFQQQVFDAAQSRADAAVKQGWGGVAWGFYGGILQHLANVDWAPFDKAFVLPVYAVAYNWVDDNKNSGAYVAGKIQDAINAERGKGYICDKAIVVSHSMGGIVSRAAAMLSGAQGNILGIVHGAQPATGAPVAYRRMRAGTESTWNPLTKIAARVLGNSSDTVMPILANSIGGLELLPTQLYATDAHQSAWLKLTRNGKDLEVLPNGEPYTSIYENKTSFLKLAFHPEYINPVAAATPHTSTSDPIRAAPGSFYAKVEAAKSFHGILAGQCHPITYSAWVGDKGLPTWDKVEYRYLKDYVEPYTVPGDGMSPPVYVDPNPSVGTGTDLWSGAYYELQDQDSKGDGTVPTSSGGALQSKSQGVGKHYKTYVVQSGLEHSAFYDDDSVRNFTVGCIKELAQKQFETRRGG